MRRQKKQKFTKKEPPKDMPEYKMDKEKEWLCQVMKDNNLVQSTSEAQRLIKQDAVSINGEKVNDVNYKVDMEDKREVILKVGKRRFLRIMRS